jgi:peptide/nickel transport system permease protein
VRFLRSLSPAGLVGLAGVGALAVLALWGAAIAPHSDVAIAGDPLSPPSWHNLLGTNRYGQDVLSQVIVGARAPLHVAAVAAIVAVIPTRPGGWGAGSTPPSSP